MKSTLQQHIMSTSLIYWIANWNPGNTEIVTEIAPDLDIVFNYSVKQPKWSHAMTAAWRPQEVRDRPRGCSRKVVRRARVVTMAKAKFGIFVYIFL